jgi:hypothetical protein
VVSSWPQMLAPGCGRESLNGVCGSSLPAACDSGPTTLSGREWRGTYRSSPRTMKRGSIS